MKYLLSHFLVIPHHHRWDCRFWISMHLVCRHSTTCWMQKSYKGYALQIISWYFVVYNNFRWESGRQLLVIWKWIIIYCCQWRIQDFPEGGANSQSGCANLLFCRKLHENERTWTVGRVPGAPLRSATGCVQFKMTLTEAMKLFPHYRIQVVCSIWPYLRNQILPELERLPAPGSSFLRFSTSWYRLLDSGTSHMYFLRC